ncbi:cytochrome P450 3A19-like [Temnothorax nylanderi]|uniref:cytochrome P450 3A19-like n=1 Tax=Temnothorax nylanderi TaxID=102681 RepID=UPI003A8A7DFB
MRSDRVKPTPDSDSATPKTYRNVCLVWWTRPFFSCACVITLMYSMMGIKLGPDENNEYLKSFQRFKSFFVYRAGYVLLIFSDVISNLTALGRKQKKDTNLIHSLTDEMIQQRIHELNNSNTKDEDNQNKTFFDIQMEASRKENFTREEIHDNVITMLLTASDTTSITMNFVVFMLANFPKIQEKVYEELLEIYGTETIKSTPIKYDDLQHMHYLNRVIKETMRIFPPAPIIGREVTEDLKIGEVTLPKGTNIFIPIIKMHRNKKYWPNPLTFDPDRFLSKEIKNCQSNYYMPFSDGPRKCIGITYAMMSMKVILATLVRTFEFKVNKHIEIDEVKLKFEMLLSTAEPLKVKLEKRYCQ